MSRVLVPAGRLHAGSDAFAPAYPEERPRVRVEVASFELEAAPVTVAEFAEFVTATGHVTTAERRGESWCFKQAKRPLTNLADSRQWWTPRRGASWRDQLRRRLLDHPVVHVSVVDAAAYAAWVGGRLPTEHEWEWACRAGTTTEYPWGDAFEPGRANTWEGVFPWVRNDFKSRAYTTPVGRFVPNAWGLFDMVGQVWEITASPWTVDERGRGVLTRPCCAPGKATGNQHAKRGGSFACNEAYCKRYRPAGRQPVNVDSDTSEHNGFRIAYDLGEGRR